MVKQVYSLGEVCLLADEVSKLRENEKLVGVRWAVDQILAKHRIDRGDPRRSRILSELQKRSTARRKKNQRLKALNEGEISDPEPRFKTFLFEGITDIPQKKQQEKPRKETAQEPPSQFLFEMGRVWPCH